MNIGERIRHRRIELGLTQTGFAKKMGLSAKSTVSKLENQGDNLTTDRIKRIAEVLECAPAYLMGWEDEEGLNTDMAQNSASLTNLGVGTRIRNKRIELELTQEELAKRMGYKSKAAICKVERGDDNITADRIRAFAKALECTPAYLMGWEDEEGLSADMAQTFASFTHSPRLLHYATLLNNLDESQKDVVYNVIDALTEKNKVTE